MPSLLMIVLILAVSWASIALVIANGRKSRPAPLKAVSVWCNWLPILATVFYLVEVGMNLWPLAKIQTLHLGDYFTKPELLIMLLAGPLFLSRAGNLIAIATLVFASARILASSSPLAASPGIVAFVISLTIAATLADCMPWHGPLPFGSSRQKIRHVLMVAISIVSCSLILVAILRVKSFSLWVNTILALGLSAPELFLCLSVVLLAWLGVLLGLSPHIFLPILSLPTYIVAAYLTNVPDSLLLVPWVAAIALTLSHGAFNQCSSGQCQKELACLARHK